MPTLYLTQAHLDLIRTHMAQQPQEEVCGLLGGIWQPYPARALAYAVQAIPNDDPRPQVRYRMSPQEQLQAMLAFDRQGWQVVAIYHSHPHGPLLPSPSDIAEWAYPDALCVIGLPSGEIGVWQIMRGKIISATLAVE